MNNLSGGYIMVDVNANYTVLRNQLDKAAKLSKPVLVYDGNDVNFMTLKIPYLINNKPLYQLIGNDVIYYSSPSTTSLQKISKNIKGEFAFDFIGNKNVNAEFHDSYIKVTATLWYSDENDSSITIDSGEFIANITFSDYITNMINYFAPYEVSGLIYDDNEAETTEYSAIIEFQDHTVNIIANDPVTFSVDSRFAIEFTLYLI